VTEKKNCHSCRHLEWVDGESDSDTGWDCNKRHTCPMDEAHEAALLDQLSSDTYRNRYKRCYESKDPK
jgi:hypothetical protein